MAVTSQIRPSGTFGEVVITQWQHARLLKPSVVKPVITTLHRRLIVRRLGQLHDDDAEALRSGLAIILNR
jgi:mRNA interferase MazF